MSQTDFEQDKRTQQAVVMRLIAFAEQHKQIPWRSMRGMRNRIAANVRRVPALQI